MTIPFSDPARDVIRQVTMRWRGTSHEAYHPAAALRLEHLLSITDWRPPSMKPAEVLLIRRLQAPSSLSGDLSLAQMSAWESALRDQLTTLYHSARRPVRGAPLPDADALLFDDMAHLLTCLTHAILTDVSGIAATARHWIWQQAVGGDVHVTGGELLAAVWSRYAAQLPAVLAALPAQTVRHAAVRLDHADVVCVLHALSHVYLLTLPAALFRWTAMPDSDPLPGVGPHMAPPWTQPIAPLMLHPHGELLIGLCAELHRAPAYVRAPQFLARLETWWVMTNHAAVNATADLSERMNTTPNAALALRPPAPPEMPRHIAPPSSRKSTTPSPTVNTPLDHALDRATEGAALPEEPIATMGRPVAEADAGIGTQLGGALFLVNVLGWLNLPMLLNPRLSGWAVLEALTWLLLETRAGLYSRDPLWATLAGLAHRAPDSLLRFDLVEPWALRLPPAWIAAPAQWTACVDGGRLLVTDEARGVLVLDLEAESNDPDAQLAREIGPYRASDAEITVRWADRVTVQPLEMSEVAPVAADTAWWLCRAAGFFRWCLAERIGSGNESLAALADLLVCKPAMLSLTPTHLDVWLPVESADVRLRRAGLDRDPGWVPDLGYVILFHFGPP